MLTLIGFVLRPGLVALPAPGGVSLIPSNALGARSLGPVLSAVLIGTLDGASAVFVILLVASVVSLTIRYRSGGRESRQQIKRIALAAAAGVICQIVALLATAATGRASALTAVYAGIVVAIGTLAGHSGGPWLAVVAALIIALLFQPVRQRAQLVANRFVHGERATPYQVLADFAEDMAGPLDFDMALDRMASILARATGAIRVEVWIRVGPQLRPLVTWPRGSAPPAAVPLIDDADLPSSSWRRVPWRSGTEASCSAR